MKIIDAIRNRFFRRWQTLATYSFGWDLCGTLPYGTMLFRNCVELLTDLANDVQWSNEGTDALRFAEWKVFFEMDSRAALWRIYKQGYAVVGVSEKTGAMRLFDEEDFNRVEIGSSQFAESKLDGWKCYVMRSEVYRETTQSDYELCFPFVKFLDNVLNSSNTASEKMGTFVVASPETPTGYNTPVVLNKPQKEELEKEIANEYGGLSKQRHIMLLPRGMKFETISLEGIDRKLNDKVRLAVLAICDRVKVPANQVAIIDANSSKTLSNGSELREGDFNKYQSFERLLNNTFVNMAAELGLRIDYTIYNKPLRQTTITQ